MDLNVNEMIEFISEQLLSKGIIVNRSDIETVLDLEMEYMIKVGLVG